MGIVYKARHKLMDRVVAIKMLKAHLVSDSMSVKRFQQEVKATGRLVHPHAITVYDFGISPDGLPYIVMDYLEGSSLSELIKKEDHVAVDRGIKIIMQACEALAHAHKQGVVHRDLKPSNIVLTNYDDDPDFVKVVDFGVAKLVGGAAEGAQRLTQTGEVCGSPVYMSPEQCLGQELDLRSDIYSMGILIYETLTGKLPLIGRTMVDTMSKHVSEMPAPFAKIRPDIYIPERIEQVVFKAMAKDANKRHQSMEELREDLDNAIPKPSRNSTLRNTQTMAAAKPVYENKSGSKKMIIMVAVTIMSLSAAALALFAMMRSGSASHNRAPVALQTTPSSPEPKKEEAVKPGTDTGTGSGTRENDAALTPKANDSESGKREEKEEKEKATNATTSTKTASQVEAPAGKAQAKSEQTAQHSGGAETSSPFTPKRTVYSAVKEATTAPVHKTHPVLHAPRGAKVNIVEKRFDGLRDMLKNDTKQ